MEFYCIFLPSKSGLHFNDFKMGMCISFSEACRRLISNGSVIASQNYHQCTPLHLAVEAGSLETVRLLKNPMLPCTLEIKNAEQNTPLHVACKHNRLDVLRFLLDKGADVTARNKDGMTCLEVAIEWDSLEVAKTLVKHKRCVR